MPRTRKDSPAWRVIELQAAKIRTQHQLLDEARKCLYLAIRGQCDGRERGRLVITEGKIRRYLEKS